MSDEFLRRPAAGEYLQSRYGFCGGKSLGRLASEGGGPLFHKVGRSVIYKKSDLDKWAAEMLGQPVSSTAEAKARKRSQDAAADTKAQPAAA
jgi:hypothetical protein